jgi:hypothetical protein
MTFELQPGEEEIPIVRKFNETGVNDCRADADAIADGKNLYTSSCTGLSWRRRNQQDGSHICGQGRCLQTSADGPDDVCYHLCGASGAMQSIAAA